MQMELSDAMFERIEQINDRFYNRYSDGTVLPLIFGGADDEDEEEDDQDDGSEDEDGSEDDQDDYVPPSRVEWEAHRAKLKKANSEAAKRRHLLEELGVDPRTGHKREDGGDDTTKKTESVRRQVEREKARIEMRYKPVLAKQATRAALAEAGFVGKSYDRVMKLIDIDEIDVDDDGDIIGVEDQIASIKTEFPEWFKRQQRKTGTGSTGTGSGSSKDVDGGSKKGQTGGAKPSWQEALARKVQREG